MCPIVNGESLSPDEAIAKNLCPECGGDLTASSPIAHRNGHWRTIPPAGIDGDEARRRMKLLDTHIADHGVVTSDVTERAAAAAKESASSQSAAPTNETREQKIARLKAELADAEGQGA